MIKTVFQELFRCLPLIRQGLALVWQAARSWTIAWGVLLIVQGLIPAALVYLTRLTINSLTAHDIQAAFTSAWIPIALIAILLIAGQLLTSLIAWVRTAQSELVQDHIKSLIHCKALELDLAFYEQPESFDLLHRAGVDAIQRPTILLENLGNLIQNLLTLLILAAMLFAYAWWLPLLLLGSALPGLWTVGRFILREHQWRINNTMNERRALYYDWMLTERECAAEMRIFDLGSLHQDAFQRLRAILRSGRLDLARAEMRAELTAGALAWGGGLAGMGWMLKQVAHGGARLGDLVLCYQAFQQGQSLLRSLMENSGQIYRSTLFLDNLFQFLELTAQITDPHTPKAVPAPLRQGICFEGVTFHYPGSNRTALRDFSLTLAAGRITAIVGRNGAGKSTLLKLLCRFYDPQQGRVLLDGVDLRELELKALHRQITVLFQEPVNYHATAAENIAMGDLTADDEQIRKAAGAGGADEIIQGLPQGYETLLGAWFGGEELSVGEWQRMALARAFLRNAPIIVLDEPTSAMDSWAEADWLGRFRELTTEKTALIITHRFTTAMHADIIHVMDEGRIIESGSHSELIAAAGHYAASWQAQMREIGNG